MNARPPSLTRTLAGIAAVASCVACLLAAASIVAVTMIKIPPALPCPACDCRRA